MKPVFLLAAAALAFISTAASAQTDLYWRADAGYGWTRNAGLTNKAFTGIGICANPACSAPGELNDLGNAWSLSGGAGLRFTPDSRADLTLGYRGGMNLSGTDGTPKSFNGKVNSWALLANGYYDVPWTGYGLRPYVGASLGFARNQLETITVNPPLALISPHTNTSFAWGLAAGLSWAIQRGVALDIAYRYTDLGAIDSGDMITAGGVATPYAGARGDLKLNELTIGVRF